MTSSDVIRFDRISKTFGSVAANRAISLAVKAGEIHALLGENGSGKTTLVNMLSGIYSPDSGDIFVYGKREYFHSPRDAIRLGIGMIHQHFKLVAPMTALENIIIGQNGSLFIGKKGVSVKIRELSARFGLEVDPDKRIDDMSIGEKQTVEILKVLYRGARVLILDEPTAVLTPQEIVRLFSILRRMKDEGCTIILITHKLHEVMDVADRITVLRRGEKIGTLEKTETSIGELTDMMVGRAVSLEIERSDVAERKPIFETRGLSVRGRDSLRAISDLSFTLSSGEILGVAGIAGSGQRELCESIMGLLPIEKGEILFRGENLAGRKTAEIIKRGISMGFVPEDRLGMGLVAKMGMVDNLILKDYRFQPGFFIDRSPARARAKKMIEDLEIQTPGINTPVKQLSGGNIQKVLLGRELGSDPEILITAYPVRGLDINSSYTIFNLLNAQKEKGKAVLFIGEDLDVLLELCDRILVLSGGIAKGILDARTATKEELGLMMLGRTEKEASPIAAH